MKKHRMNDLQVTSLLVGNYKSDQLNEVNPSTPIHKSAAGAGA